MTTTSIDTPVLPERLAGQGSTSISTRSDPLS